MIKNNHYKLIDIYRMHLIQIHPVIMDLYELHLQYNMICTICQIILFQFEF